MPASKTEITRRAFVAALGAATLLPGSLGVAAGTPTPRRRHYVFFDAAEARFIEAACARLMYTSGSMGVAIAHSLDEQFAGEWGSGKTLYRTRTWQAGTATPRQPKGLAPSLWFRQALGVVIAELDRQGSTFAALPGLGQDQLLGRLQAGGRDLNGIPCAAFFDLLLTLAAEGFLSDPASAACDLIRWPMNAFPGAHAALLAPYVASGLA